ncbi:tetratricopeptide repeat protein, partial [Rhodobacteraceae bacterium]|nr:tetratricopeptide repeat protein [Paracoccaceae bacterium]
HFYKAILKSQPEHPDANHNAGVLAVDVGKVSQAIPFLRLALEKIPDNTQYLISYIDALIRLESIDSAQNMLKQAKQRFSLVGDFDELEERIETLHKKSQEDETDLTKKIQWFYQKKQTSIIQNAFAGWLFFNNFDSLFHTNFSAELKKPSLKLVSKDIACDKTSNPNKIFMESSIQKIQDLNNIVEIKKKFYAIKKIIKDRDPIITHDDFRSKDIKTIFPKRRHELDRDPLNILIMGGGVSGLFLSTIMKNKFKQKMNIVVLDNRSDTIGIRKVFDRDWLTHINKNTVNKLVPNNIKNLIECFGKNDKIGLPLNILETILMTSCRAQGVRFYFSPVIDHSSIHTENIDLIFDATGGRFIESDSSDCDSSELKISFEQTILNFSDSGISQKSNYAKSQGQYLEISLKPINGRHYPFINCAKIQNHMIKITNIPIHLIDTLLKYVRNNNHDNLFYVWKGSLKDEINHGLLIINLNSDYHTLFSKLTAGTFLLSVFYHQNYSCLSKIDNRINKIFKILIDNAGREEIYIEPPFTYSPHIKLSNNTSSLNAQTVFPIGDSLFSGNPKMGNGLSSHLNFLNELTENLSV